MSRKAGNVWEWTRSLWGKDWQKAEFVYPYHPLDGREDTDAGDDICRVLRGGSFCHSVRSVRCAYRRRLDPRDRPLVSGFRVCCGPHSNDALEH